MANEKNDISDIVKKCKILLLDIEGTTTSISFVKDKLFPYAEENVKDFLTSEWEVDDVKEAVKALRKQAVEDEEKKVEGVVTIPGEDASKEDQIEALVKSVKWQMSSDRKVGPLKQLQGLIWKKGYDKGDIKGHVYDDVPPALELWRSVEGQKVYIYSSGSVQAQKLLFSMSSAGDLLKFIDGHFDTSVGAKQETASYTAIAEKIECKPEDILFLTDIDKEAAAARAGGVCAALVSREGNAPLSAAAAAAHPVLYSLADLAATNKRKPDAQDEQPAKVMKTDVETDVKSAPEAEVKEIPAQPEAAPIPEKAEEPEKMEVEEEVPAKETIPADKPAEVAEKVETTVEEVTDSKDIADVPVCDVEPVIEETSDKTEEKQTEKMETESTETTTAVPEKATTELKNGDISAPVPEETPPAVITEIKDITNDKESLSEVAEIIEDLVPVVEEPPAQDIEELQNVGEVLEKECDEILSKVQDVTNLDNIPLKPLLNPISEETMETENVDSNDIVERILDTELEMEMKQCADIDLNTVQEITDAKTATEEDKTEKPEIANNETKTVVPEEKAVEKVVEEAKVTEEKVETSSPTEEKVQESSVAQKTEESIPTDVKVDEGKVTNEEKTKTEEKVENKMETEENIKIETDVSDKMETDVSNKAETEENKMETEVSSKAEKENSTPETVDTKPKAEENKTEDKVEEKKVEVVKSATESKETVAESKETPAENNSMETEQTATPTEKETKPATEVKEAEKKETETKESDKVASESVAEEVKPESDAKETQVNGKATNGDADMVNLNGDASKDDELSARLSMENGKEVVNGANGDSTDADKKSENSGDEVKEVADIKVKTVAVDEPRNDPIEQPTEA